jgi:hypothetical protein
MGRTNHAKRDMSSAMATVYKELIDDLKFAKQQQWMTTNYLMLVLAAIFAISKSIGPLTVIEKGCATFLVVGAVLIGYGVLINLQLNMRCTRKRLSNIERMDSGFFTAQERSIAHIKEYKWPFWRGLPILAVLMLAAFVGALLVGYSVWRSTLCVT